MSSRALWTIVCVVVAAAAGCEERVVSTGLEGFGTAAPPPQPYGSSNDPSRSTRSSSPRAEHAAEDVTWAIYLGMADGPNHARAAEQRRAEIVTATGLGDVWVDDEGTRSKIYYGRYKDPDGRQARSDLARWRQVRTQRSVYLPTVMIVPTHLRGSMPEYDLLRVDPEAQYTWELGYYDREFGRDFRQAAEKAVAALREDGWEAYYYHAHDRSTVTIGTFGHNAFRQRIVGGQVVHEISDPRLNRIERQFPRYMHNGLEVRVRTVGPDGESLEPQPATVVEIPR